MQRLVYVCLCVFLCSFTLDRVKFMNMLNRPAPSWMDRHIQEDLGGFQKADVTKEMIDKTIQDVYSLPGGNGAQFVRYQIINNKLHWSSATEVASDPRISHFVAF